MKTLKTIGFMTITVFFCLLTSVVYSKEVSQTEAEQIAQSWITQNFDVTMQVFYGSQESELTCTEIKRNEYTVAYSFEKPRGGFVLVASNDRMGSIIGYSEKNKFDPNIPPMKKFLDAVYDVLTEDNIYANQGNLHPLVGTSSVGISGPLLKTRWSQSWPYSDYCPTTYYIDHATHSSCLVASDTPAGCVAVALGQIMKYHGYPPQGKGSHEFLWTCTSPCENYPTCTETGICELTTLYANFEINYDWNNMVTSINASSSDAQIKAISRLLYHIGVAVEMNYSSISSGAHSEDARDALREYFDYESTAEYLGRDFDFDTEQWFSILTDEITNNRPVYYDGTRNAGHAFVLDGVDDTRGDLFYVHLNYGWGGNSDGWYDTGFFYLFTVDHNVILGISPAQGTPGGGAGGQPSAPSGTTGPRESSSGCFIATAAYGTPLAREVRVLSKFRDEFLLKNTLGESFIRNYHKISPCVAEFIRNKAWLKKIIRCHLKPIVLITNLFISDDTD